MKRVIYIPKTNIIQFDKTINDTFRAHPIYLLNEDIDNKEARNINIVSENIIKIKESRDPDDNKADKKDDNQNTSGHLDILRSKLDAENNDNNPRVDSDPNKNKEE